MRARVCGVPKASCSGSDRISSKGIRQGNSMSIRCHSTPEEAFRCMVNYLVHVQGYTRIGSREFSPPDGGPIKVLTKKARYGAELRGGKSGDVGTSKVVMPKGAIAGIMKDA